VQRHAIIDVVTAVAHDAGTPERGADRATSFDAALALGRTHLWGVDHWTCAAPGWEAVADHALEWAAKHARTTTRT
jgi:hypothetical protein